MTSEKDKIPVSHSWPWWRWVITGLNTLTLVLSAVLSWHYVKGGTMIGCGGGSPCDHVLSSRWSVVAGIIPVSGLAMGAYLAMLFAGFFIGRKTESSIRRLAWITMLAIAGSVIGSALWFTILQKWFIGEFCPYCMTEHISGTILSALIIWCAIKNSDIVPVKNDDKVNKAQDVPLVHATNRLPVLMMISIGLLISGLLVIFQVSFAPPKYQDGSSLNNMPANDYHNVPLIGPPDAPFVVDLLFDYQCPHCQQLHFMLNEVVQRYKGKLSFAICPVPLNPRCNPYIPQEVDAYKNSCELAKIGMAVWLADHNLFPVFESWMFTFESGDRWRPRKLEAAKAKAVELVGQAKFETAFNDDWIGKYVQSSVLIYGRTIQDGRGGVPRLVFGSRWVIPQPENVDDLIMIIQNSLNIPGPGH